MDYRHSLTYVIHEIPDPNYTAYQAASGGDVKQAITAGWEHLLRTVANMPYASCTISLILAFNAKIAPNQSRQSRLSMYLRIQSVDASTAKSLETLVTHGMLSRFYPFEKADGTISLKAPTGKRYTIIRREDLIQPLYARDYNYKIPERYYAISPYVSRPDNDYSMLDRILDSMSESIWIDILIQPVDISTQLHAHTAYLARLGSINHYSDMEDEDHFVDPLDPESHRYASMRDKLKPLSLKDPLANDILRTQREFHKTLLERHLAVSADVRASSAPVAQLVCSLLAESAFQEGSYRIVDLRDCDTVASNPKKRRDSQADYQDLKPLTRLATVDELLGLFRLPIASNTSPLCCRKNTDPPHVSPENLIDLGYDQQSGVDRGHPISRGPLVDTLKKHVSVFGLPGSGKTTNNLNILFQLHEREIPFLVIECRKREYRVIKTFKQRKTARFCKLARALQVYTPGVEDLSPFRFNLLELMPGINSLEQIESLIADLKASVPISVGSLPALVGEALEKVYQDFPDPKCPPVISDLIEIIELVLAAKGYAPETRADMLTAIETRLGVLAQRAMGKTLQCRHGIPTAQLMQQPTLLELDILPPDQACLQTLCLLSAICKYLRTVPPPEKALSYLVLIEEAHVIFGSDNNTPASEEIADTKTCVAERIVDMLVTLRALGVGIILSDQHPTALNVGASKSVASKLAFRQVYQEDCEELGRSMLFGKVEMQDIARLRPGEAFFFTEGYFEPLRIKTPNLSEHLQLVPPPSNDVLRAILVTETWFQRARTNRITDELEQLKEAADKIDGEQHMISDQVEQLLQAIQSLLQQKSGQQRQQHAKAIGQRLRGLRRQLQLSQQRFIKGAYYRFGYLKVELDAAGVPKLEAFGRSLFDRWEATLQPGIQKLIVMIDSHINRCGKLT